MSRQAMIAVSVALMLGTWSEEGMSLAQEPMLIKFVETHCVRCHGVDKQENGWRFDELGEELVNVEALEHWQAIRDQLQQGTMPPQEEPQPDEEEIGRMIEVLEPRLREASEALRSTGRVSVIRRLNRFELRNTIRDLLYLDGAVDYRPDVVTKLEDRNGDGVATWSSDDPTREFPADELEEGLDTIGARLVMSDFLLSQMLSAAEVSLERATFSGSSPGVYRARFEGPIRTEGPEGDLQKWARDSDPSYDLLYRRYREPGAATGGVGRVTSNALASRGVPTRGRYRIRVTVSAHHREHPWGDLIHSRAEEPFRLGLHAIDSRENGLNESNPRSFPLTEWEVPDDGLRHLFEFDVDLDAGWLPWIGWENGPYDRGLMPSRLVERYYPARYRPTPGEGASELERSGYEPSMAKELMEAGFQGPHLRVYSLEIEQLDFQWPPESHVALYGKDGSESIEMLFVEFARRAFRRPVSAEEISPFVDLVEREIERGLDRSEALRMGYLAILVSPSFYYLPIKSEVLDDYELASRLSYFLWSSMPDEQLFTAAAMGLLRDEAGLRAEVERLLNDPKAAAFHRRFTERWLRLDKLGSMPPPGGFYFHRQMEPQMRKQVDAYFAHLVQTDAPIREIVDADYTFLNERLAQWVYQRDDIWGDRIRKVSAMPPHGGGILTMPAVMTATANGVDTSPVVRGVWVLEQLLGTPPAPPPPDVEPLSPDLRQAKTIREQLEAHRAQAACANCHRKIDPLGLPFESFDELGLWRTHYRNTQGNPVVDPSTILPHGLEISNIQELKQYLVVQEPLITRHLAEKLLAYGLGRGLEPTDRVEIDRLLEQLELQQGGVKTLIHLVVSSELFRLK